MITGSIFWVEFRTLINMKEFTLTNNCVNYGKIQKMNGNILIQESTISKESRSTALQKNRLSEEAIAFIESMIKPML